VVKISNTDIPLAVRQTAETLEKAGFEAYLVVGRVLLIYVIFNSCTCQKLLSVFQIPPFAKCLDSSCLTDDVVRS
jgi:hypothetical protein